MNKSRLTGIIAIGLLISNLALVAFIFAGAGKRPRHEGPRNIIIERLHFDKKQIDEYNILINGHRQAIRSKEEEILHLKNALYQTLNSNETTKNDSLKEAIGKIQMQIEDIHYNHFMDIGKLCRTDQKKYFSELINDIAQLFARPMPKHDPL